MLKNGWLGCSDPHVWSFGDLNENVSIKWHSSIVNRSRAGNFISSLMKQIIFGSFMRTNSFSAENRASLIPTWPTFSSSAITCCIIEQFLTDILFRFTRTLHAEGEKTSFLKNEKIQFPKFQAHWSCQL